MRKLKVLCSIFVIALLCGCQNNNTKSDQTLEYTSEDITLTSQRNTDIPATVVVPKGEEKHPYVVLLHGFIGERNGCNNFEPTANQLAEKGIASIRIDFPGNGDSKEAYTAYDLTNMTNDISSAIDIMQSKYNGDQNHVGLIGHSMGGRIVSLYLNDKIQAAALWAPAANTGLKGLADFMGGNEAVEKMYNEAKEKGASSFKLWGEPYVDCSLKFFEENKAADPLKNIAQYNGKLMIAVDDFDEYVSKETTNNVINAAKKIEVLNVANSDHVFDAADGSGSQEPRQLLVDETVQFFINNLK